MSLQVENLEKNMAKQDNMFTLHTVSKCLIVQLCKKMQVLKFEQRLKTNFARY